LEDFLHAATKDHALGGNQNPQSLTRERGTAGVHNTNKIALA
jgi:hypothetical protein